ncbi:MAG: hypothetical protein ABEN55_04010 [Bradymonadaceae bacterium]
MDDELSGEAEFKIAGDDERGYFYRLSFRFCDASGVEGEASSYEEALERVQTAFLEATNEQ